MPNNKPQIAHKQGKLITLFPDQSVTMLDTHTTTQRELWVDGKPFIVRSIFPNPTPKTPLDQMLKLVELSGKDI
ncbi:hypothetical protein RFF05_10340 [Bengtsoniella intestinalis]|uniref:hypothetical protein n=1 Tax=Bengtsoniella intestinalis TaxID=3073143 RepID=UPI00391F7565